MKKISFLFGIHNHQPIGNFDEVFEGAYQKSYAPFLDVLLKHPMVKWNLHCSGILWEWIEKRHPNYLEMVQTMVRRNQVELLSGGFYEPILSVLPDADKVGQILKLSQYLNDHFGVRPQGMWCAERVWEPHLPAPIRRAGIQYTVLDDTHFLAAGLSKNQLAGYYRVEEQNDGIDIFPISQELRYTIPFQEPAASIEIFKNSALESSQDHSAALTMADDGEKFGFWPKTFQSVYEEGWLEKFLHLLEKNSEWLHTETFSDHRKNSKPLGKIYLPTASYFEMSEWSLPTDSGLEFEETLQMISNQEVNLKLKKFLKGGFWRNFLAKYPESNWMYKKMLRVSQKVHRVKKGIEQRAKSEEQKTKNKGQRDTVFSKCSKLMAQALDHLWAGQCNCSYWHGVFGGLYLPVLRQAIYKNLIEAEKILDSIIALVNNGRKKAEEVSLPKGGYSLASPTDSDGFPADASSDNGSSFPHALGERGAIEISDFDGDGNEEVIFESPLQNLLFSPHDGGSIIEWDIKPAGVNIVNVLSRRPETYHKKVKKFLSQSEESKNKGQSIHDILATKEKGLENYLSYDWYKRVSLIDHFLHPDTTLESFQMSQYGEQGDFVLGRYDCEVSTDASAPYLIKFARNGAVWVQDQKRNLKVEKALSVDAGKTALQVSYRISNLSNEFLEVVWFAPEFNFSFSVFDREKDVPFKKRKEWERVDPYLFWKLKVIFSDFSDGWIFPLETVSNSESGFEKTFQGIVFLPYWKFSLQKHKSFEKFLTFNIESLS